MHRTLLSFALALFTSAFASGQTTAPKTVTAAEADSHIIERIEPTIPPLAKAARIGGTIKFQIVISPSGTVATVRVLSGHPMLLRAGMDAVKQWKYRPFTEGSESIAVETEVSVFFPGGMSAEESAARNKYFPLERECRALLDDRRYADAERKCREAVEASDPLPEEASFEHSVPRALLAHSIFFQGRVADAVPLYEEALALDMGHLKPNDADLASDYANLARAYARLNELAKADQLYATSVSTFEAAIQNLPEMKDNYTRRLQRTLNEYAEVKEAQGQMEAAEQLRKKAAGLPVVSEPR